MSGSSYHNVFYYYRGPTTASVNEENRYHRQVEDNSTKALINTLELGGPALTRSFVRKFTGLTVTGDPAFSLQSGPSSPLVSEKRFLLGLSILGEIDQETMTEKPHDGTGRVDAAIHVAGELALFIETKTVERLDGRQLYRHAKDWDIATPASSSGAWSPPSDWILVTWTDVWRWAQGERKESPEASVAHFVLDQFCDYLEILGFAPWAGFRPEDFDFFRAPSVEQLEILRNRMTGLWQRVLEELDEPAASLLLPIHVGRMGLETRQAWAQTNRNVGWTNLTVELNELELQLNLVGWTADQANALERWLSRNRPPGGMELVAFERRATRTQAGKPWWMGAPGQVLKRFGAEEIVGGGFVRWRDDWRRSNDLKWKRLAFHLRRTFSRPEVIALEDRLAHEFLRDVKRLWPILAEINGWSSSTVGLG